MCEEWTPSGHFQNRIVCYEDIYFEIKVCKKCVKEESEWDMERFKRSFRLIYPNGSN